MMSRLLTFPLVKHAYDATSHPGSSDYLDNGRLAERFAYPESATADLIWDRDRQSGSVWWSENAWTLFGLTFEEAAASPDWWIDRVHPNDRQRYVALVGSFLEGAVESWSAEIRFRVADGTYRRFFSRGFFVRKD